MQNNSIEKDILDHLPALIGYWDSDLKNAFSNKYYAEFFGKTPRQIQGKSMHELLGPDLYQKNLPFIQKVLSGQECTFEREMPKIGGGSRTMLAKYVPDRERDHVIGFFVIVTDITLLKSSDSQSEGTAKAAETGLFKVDLVGNLFFGSETWWQMSGLKPGPVAVRDWMNVIYPVDYERFYAEWQKGLSSKISFEILTRMGSLEGEIRYVLFRFSEIVDSLGSVVGYFGLVQDAKSFRAAALFNEFYRVALDQCAIVAFTDPKGKITYANDKFCQISGYSLDELIGNDHRLVNSGKMGKEFFRQMWQTISKGQTWEGEICNRSKSGHDYWVSTSILPFLGPAGEVESYVAIRRDITQEKRQQQELIQAREVALNASQAKTDFLATVSHEIRTPLNGVIGMTQLLVATPSLNQQQLECAEVILHSSQTLLSLINDVLDFSKIEAGKIELEEAEIDLAAYLGEVLKPFQYACKMKEIEFKLSYNEYPNLVYGDPGKLGQVISNLVSNAVKFTPKGCVSVSIQLEARGDLTHGVISVNDTGIGISDAARGNLFQDFSQAEHNTSRLYGGTGLGLSISRRLLELMKGQISVESVVGKGTTFTVEISLKTAQAKPKSIPNSAPNPCAGRGYSLASNSFLGSRVLVAEDNLTNRTLLQRILQKWGIQVQLVSNGLEALQAAERECFDLILMDCQMPQMDGYEATRAIRSLSGHYERIPIIALTAHVLQGAADHCKAAGMSDYLPKPINLRDLEKMFQNSLNSSRMLIDPEALNIFEDLHMEGLPDILVETIDAFLKTTPKRVGDLVEAIRVRDLAALSHEAHCLKSAAVTLGAFELVKACQLLEDLKDAQSLDQIEELKLHLQDLFSGSCQELRAIKMNRLRPQDKNTGVNS